MFGFSFGLLLLIYIGIYSKCGNGFLDWINVADGLKYSINFYVFFVMLYTHTALLLLSF